MGRHALIARTFFLAYNMGMPQNDMHLINLTFLENRLGELGLKNWWVAEAIGVDRKTVSRWLSGKVKTIKQENLLALSECLKCQPENLILKDEATIVASKEEQAIAADLIVQENLLATLTPSGQWPLLESIVKATMQPNLPLPIMGKLYNLLSICSWRQSSMEKALGFATKAYEIGKQIGHRGVIAQAQNNLAIIAAYHGRLQDSISLYESVINSRDYLEDERTIAAALSNLAQEYQIYGDFEKSRKIQTEAIALYTKLGLPLNLSIAFCGLGLLETELKNYDAAESALQKSHEFAISANYIRGIHATKIYLADCAAGKGDFELAEKLLSEGWKGFEDIKLGEALNYEIKARCLRLQKRFAEADQTLNQGFVFAEKFPIEKASLFMERARLSQAMGDQEKFKIYKQRAFDIYKKSGALLRLQKNFDV
jgi:tetratricopeptide (TPR) repeat protein